MNELERWAKPTAHLVPSREERAHNQAVRAIMNDARETAMRIDAEAAITARFMDRAVDLDAHRKALAGDDPTLNAVLMRIELGFVTKGEQHQRGFTAGLKL